MKRSVANRRTPMRHADGITLVELLVAVALLATMTAGGLTAYAQASATWRAQAAAQRRHERAQYVFGTLEPELQMAGYFGDARPAAQAASTIPPQLRACGIDTVARLDHPVERLGTLPPACVPRTVLRAGSDVLLVRRASARTSAPRAGRPQWFTTGDPAGTGELLWNGAVPPAAVAPQLRDLQVRLYYVANGADGDAGTPALRVKTLTEVAGAPAFVDTEVMPGVESLAVELLPQASPRAVRVGLRVRADGADADLPDADRVLSVTRHFTLRNAPVDAH